LLLIGIAFEAFIGLRMDTRHQMKIESPAFHSFRRLAAQHLVVAIEDIDLTIETMEPEP
jgi:hypothetical protein